MIFDIKFMLGWGNSATFSDPDGNLFSINQFPQKDK
jgi:hypothetical protein